MNQEFSRDAIIGHKNKKNFKRKKPCLIYLIYLSKDLVFFLSNLDM